MSQKSEKYFTVNTQNPKCCLQVAPKLKDSSLTIRND